MHPFSRPKYFGCMMNKDSVLQDGDDSAFGKFALFVKTRHLVDDVVRLPFTGTAARINKRWELAINRSRMSVGIGVVLVTVEHLNLNTAREEHSAVATSLTFAFGTGW